MPSPPPPFFPVSTKNSVLLARTEHVLLALCVFLVVVLLFDIVVAALRTAGSIGLKLDDCVPFRWSSFGGD